MRRHRIREIPEESSRCLTCACLNEDNVTARALLTLSEAMTAAGVIAAVFIAESNEHSGILHLAREAIREQREWCRAKGPFRPGICRMRHQHHPH